MSIDLKFVELMADVLENYFQNTYIVTAVARTINYFVEFAAFILFW